MSHDVATKERTSEAEQAVLASVLLAPETLGTVAAIVAPADFYHRPHARIFDAMLEIDARGWLVDPVTLSERLRERGELEAVGGKDFIAYLLDVVPSAANAAGFAGIVRDQAQRRALVVAFEQGARLAREGQTPPALLATQVRTTLQRFELASGSASGAGRFALYDDDEIASIPTPAWLVEGVLPSQALALLVGEKGTLKTFAALDVAASVQLGLDWHDRRVRAGATCYVYGEGHTGIAPRVAAWKQFHGVDRLGVLFLPQRVTMNDAADVAGLLTAIEAKLGHRDLALIVVDTLNRNMTGNENSSEDMSAFVRGCDQLREATGATVLVVHHKGHGQDDRGRGSSVLDAAADTIVFASRDADHLTLECRKQKDAGEFATMAFEALPSAHSLVLKPSGVTSGGLIGNRRKILVALHENSTADGATYKTWAELSGLSASSFNKAREWLKANGLVIGENGKWRVTDIGRRTLRAENSTNSTTTPPVHGGARSINSTPLGGVYIPPSGGVDPLLPQGGAGTAGPEKDAAAHGREPSERLSAQLLELAREATTDPVTVPDGDRTHVLELLARSCLTGPLRARTFRAVRYGATRAELRAITAELAQ